MENEAENRHTKSLPLWSLYPSGGDSTCGLHPPGKAGRNLGFGSGDPKPWNIEWGQAHGSHADHGAKGDKIRGRQSRSELMTQSHGQASETSKHKE